MLAFAWPSDWDAHDRHPALAERLASSLCAGIGGFAGAEEIDGMHFAYRPLRATPAVACTWRPALLPTRQIVVFHGYFDNAAAIAADLHEDQLDPAWLYGLAVQHWGDEAERRIIGEYCAIIADRSNSFLRLSRSPLRAPPLYYFHNKQLTAAASVPRALFTAGVERRLNEVRLADMLMRNFADEEASSFETIAQVPTGSIVELVRNQPRSLRKWYDLMEVPFHDVTDDSAAIATVEQLLDEGVRACLAGFREPGTTLSGGLDSPQVAVHALGALPPDRKLPTFTFHPEAGFDGRAPNWKLGDERQLVEAFAAMHPRLEPHFTDNAGREHDYRCEQLFHLTGDPAGVPGNYVFHGLLSDAAKRGCDVLLLAEWGNQTFSDKGECGFVEYFLTGRWRQLWLALTRPPIHSGSLLRRFGARSLAALLPNRLWQTMRRLVLRKDLLSEIAQPLSPEYRRTSGTNERLRRSGKLADRHQPWNRRHLRRLLAGDGDPAPYYQGLEQMYGVAMRDPTAYRPLVEYCLGLPTKMFLRNGELRWLAKQMAKGVMPEEQRRNALNGWWDADWHVRIGRRREEWLSELDRMERDDRLGRMFDVPRLRAALENWPRQTEIDPQKAFAVQLAVPIALVTARFVNYVEGRNQ
jgi:asparagine synthase (glutamine-hydrolysing)